MLSGNYSANFKFYPLKALVKKAVDLNVITLVLLNVLFKIQINLTKNNLLQMIAIVIK